MESRWLTEGTVAMGFPPSFLPTISNLKDWRAWSQ